MTFWTEVTFLKEIQGYDTASFHYEDYRIRASECDEHGFAHTHILFSICQEVSNGGADKAGLSAAKMRELGATWVLSRVSLELKQSPRWRDKVRVYTWQSDMDRISFMRDYYMFDESGEPFGTARASWNIISLAEHKLLGPTTIFPDRKNPHLVDLSAFTDSALRLRANYADFADAEPFPVTAGYSAIDRNGHVNNTRYVAMSIDAAQRLLPGHALARYDINFVTEMLKGDSAEVLAVALPENQIAVKALSTTGKDHFRALITYR